MKKSIGCYNIDSAPKCRVCQGNTKFYNFGAGYRIACSQECSYKDVEKYQLGFRNGSRLKEHYLPSGAVVEVMGYEGQVIDWLLKHEIISEADLCLSGAPKMPMIPYTAFGKKHHYLPDVYLPDANLLFEIKSSYTYMIEQVLNDLKLEAAAKAGYSIEMIIWDEDKQIPISREDAMSRHTGLQDRSEHHWNLDMSDRLRPN